MNIIYRSQFIKSATILTNNVHRHVAYKSAVSLDTVYPHSTLKLSTPSTPPNKNEGFTGYIPIDKLDITYSRSTGPGGQNVNSVNTKVDLRFNINSASWITDDIKMNLLKKYRTKISKDGYLIFRSDVTRSQQLNLADCLEKVRTAIRSTFVTTSEISEETQEKIRRRQERAIRERLNIKRQKSQIKAARRDPSV